MKSGGAASGSPLSPGQIFRRRFRRHRTAMVALAVLFGLYLVSLLAGFVAPYHYETQDRDRFFHPPTRIGFAEGGLVVHSYQPAAGTFQYEPDGRTVPLRWLVAGDEYRFLWFIPTRTHLFGAADGSTPVFLLGCDQFGRDVFSRLLYGSQISLSIGLVGIAISFAIGLVIGGVSAYFGGWVDGTLMRGSEFVMSIPTLYLIIALRVSFPPEMSSAQTYAMIVAILSLVGWAGTARVIRGMGLSLRERPFVLAAKAMGATPWRVITRHILPSTFSYVIVAATLMVPYYILGEVVLSYLAVGIQEPQASWGTMLVAAQNTAYLREYPWLLSPGLAIFVTVLAFNFVGDGLRDAADAKSAGI